MDWVNTWITALNDAFNDTIVRVGSFLPNLLIAIIIFLVGWVLASIAGGAVSAVLRKIKIDRLSENVGLGSLLKNTGLDFDLANFTGWIVKWFVVLIFLIAVAETLNLPQISGFIDQVAGYIPNVIAAAIILIIGIVIADALSNVVRKATGITRVVPAVILGSIARWSVLVFTFLAALAQLNVARDMIQILFAGIVITTSIALGLAFGLGGKDEAKRILEQMTKSKGKR
jgi:hypothetical protein